MPAWPLALLLLAASDPVEPIARLDHPELREVSGIVQSRRHPGIFWAHNDSGNPPALFAVRLDGTVLRRYDVAAPNIDWEDIATDDDGHLYLGDIGNNGGRLATRAILRFDEPDPAKPPDGPLRPTWTTFYRFDDSGPFDAEALVVDRDRLVLISKRLDLRAPAFFTLSTAEPGTTDRPIAVERLGPLRGIVGPITGADLAPDGRRLAVCGYFQARVFEREPGGDWRPIGRVTYRAGQVEAIAWDGDDLILTNEPGALFRVPEASWRADGDSP